MAVLWERGDFLGKSLSPVPLGNHEGTSQVISGLCTLVSVGWSGWEKVWGQVPQHPNIISVS